MQAFHGVSDSFGHPPVLTWGHSSDAGGWISAPPGSPWAAGALLLYHGLHYTLQGTLCLNSCSTSCSSSSTNLCVCPARMFSFFHPAAVADEFFLSLKSVMPQVLPSLLTGSALPHSVVLESAGTDSLRHRGNFRLLLTEVTPASTLPPKSCHESPI